MAAVDPNGNQKYWVNGDTFQGIRFQAANTGSQKFWFEGQAEENLFPPNNNDTGRFLLVFE